MTKTRSQNDDLVMRLVDEGLARPESERDRFLRSACAEDPELLTEVLSRIGCELRMNGFLLEPLLPHTPVDYPFQAGELLAGRFLLLRKIGEGAMGVVYEAVDKKLDKRIAVKSAKPAFQWRLPPEARNATEISHPNVCKINEIHTASTPDGDVDFLTMEYLDGETLSERIRRLGGFTVDQVSGIIAQICAGIEEAHRKGIVHGDLKSSNIMLIEGAHGGLRPVITDFGLAHQTTVKGAGALHSSVYGGTPAYMAPELWRGEKPSAASDLYALGVILYEVIHAELPLREHSHVYEPNTNKSKHARASPHVPRRFDAIITQCLEADPTRRPRSAAEVASAIAKPHAGWRVARIAAVLLVLVMSGLPYVREGGKDRVRLVVLPFAGPQGQRPVADRALAKTSDLLQQVKLSGRLISVVPWSETIRRNIRTPSQACRELGATHILRGELQPNGETLAVRAEVADACSQQMMKEVVLEFPAGTEDRIPLALAGSITGSLHLPPVRSSETVNVSAMRDYSAGLTQLQHESQVDEAIDSLRRAAASDSHSPLVWAALAEAYYLKYQLTSVATYRDGAATAASRAESLNPDAAPVCRISGMLLTESGKYARAVEEFRRAIELDPGDSNAYRGLASAQQQLGQDQEAIQALTKSIELAPGNFKSYRQLGGVYYDLGEFTKAAEYFRRVVELIPDMPEGHFSVAVTYIKLGRYAEAEQELKTALTLREDWNSLVSLGATLAYKGEYTEAIRCYKKAIALAPQRYLAWVNIADNYRRTKQQAQARTAYEQALRLTRGDVRQNPQHAYIRAFTAYLLAQLGNREQAEYEIGQSLGSPSKDTQLLRVAALTYEALGKRDETILILKDAPWALLDDLSRQPDMAELRRDPRFVQMLGHKATK